MKSILGVCLFAIWLTGVAAAQDAKHPVLREGIPVKLPVAGEAEAMPAADKLDAVVIAVTESGKTFVGVKPADLNALSGLSASTVYVKADASAPWQQVLSVLETLRGHTVILLTAPTVKAEAGKITPPYGVELSVEKANAK